MAKDGQAKFSGSVRPQPVVQTDPNHFSAARIAGIYLLAGLLWIGISDLTLAGLAGLTLTAILVSIGKGSTYVVLSAALVYWLCRLENRKSKQTMALLQSVVEGTSDAVFVKDCEGRYLMANTAAAGFLGKTVDQILGRDDRELFPAMEADQLRAGDKAIMDGGRAVTRDEQLTSAGVTRTYHATKAPYYDAAGKTAGLIGISRDVTDRAQVESTLRETDTRLREAQRIARMGSWSWEPRINRVWWSDALFNLFNLKSQAIQPSFGTFLELLHPDDRQTAIDRVQTMLDGADEFANDLRVVRADGTCMWIHSRALATRDASGALIRVEGTDQDITAQRKAREAILESERRLQSAAEVAGLGIIEVDYQDQIATFSPQAAEQFGLADGIFTATRKEVHSRFHPADREKLNKLIEQALAKGSTGWFAFDHRIVWPDGTIRWLSVRKQVTFENGRPERAVVVSVDVTDRRNAEDRYRMLFDSNPHPMWVYDIDSLRFLEVNDAAIESYGYTRDEFLNMSIRDIRPSEEVARLEASVARTGRGLNRSSEWKHRHKNGQVFDVDISSHDLPEQHGRARLVLALNITDRKRAEAELLASERRLRLALEAAGAIAFVWDVPNNVVTRYFSNEPALPATAETVGTLDEVRRIIHPDDLSSFNSRLSECLSGGSEYRNAYRVVRPDGSTASLEEFGYLDRTVDGSPLRLTGMSIDVSDRVIATEALRSSEERLREAAQVAGFGVFEHDHIRGEMFWSPRLREIYGVNQDARPDLKLYLDLIDPADLDAVETAVRRAHDPTGDGRFDVEHRLIRASDGQTRWLVVHSQSHFAGEGSDRSLVRTVGATVDATESRLAAEALSSSEARYRQLVDLLPTAIFVHGDNRILYGNPAFLQLLGATDPDQLLGRSPFEISHPSSHQFLRERQADMFRTGLPLPGCEMQAVRLDGRAVPVYVLAAPISSNGKPSTLVALSDMTERERATVLLRSVMDSVGDAILTVDDLGIMTSTNRATERLFGYIEKELVGCKLQILIPNSHCEQFDGKGSVVLAKAQKIGSSREVEGVRKDGTTFPAELTITEFLRNGVREFTAVLRDITARRQLEEQFRQSQKMEAVGRLAGGVAHDFNNLLTVINGYCELVLEGLDLDHAARGPLVAIHDAGDRAARLTQQLLALSRKSMIEPKLVDLNELVAVSAKLFERLIGEDVTLDVRTDTMPVRVVLDPGQLEQVLMNLVVNARDAMPTGGRLAIETRNIELGNCSQHSHADLPLGKYALLQVTDTGCGISSEIRDKIFEPFFTTKGVGKGTGLGLAVVHGIVQQSGGAIKLESSIGNGTTFSILFPSVTESASTVPHVETALDLQGNETVLLAEDEESVRKLVQLALEGQGYTVITATTGLDAVSVLRTSLESVDLLVTDVIMPEISGPELANLAREICPRLRVLYMSGYTDDALDRHGLKGTTDLFIQKPFTPLTLLRRIREILDRSE